MAHYKLQPPCVIFIHFTILFIDAIKTLVDTAATASVASPMSEGKTIKKKKIACMLSVAKYYDCLCIVIIFNDLYDNVEAERSKAVGTKDGKGVADTDEGA